MTPPDTGGRTIGGLAGEAVDKAKEALGQAADSDEPEREGGLQRAQSEADRSVPAAESSSVRAAQAAERRRADRH